MSEFSIIARYFGKHQLTGYELGVGDDCAIIQPKPNQELIICTDTLISGRHFPINTSAHAIGYKSVAVNLSDLAAMGATPHSILLALSLPQADENWLRDFSQGLYDICDAHHVKLIGGDTTKSPTLTISITALGFTNPQKSIKRSGAQVGDLICVGGEIGSASYALHHPNSTLQNALDYPKPQVKLGQLLVDFAHSMIDVSDGLAQDLGHILTSSHVNGKIHLDAIPMDAPLKNLPFDIAINHVLNGGDDYKLCFTLSQAKFNAFRHRHPNIPIYPIGEIMPLSTNQKKPTLTCLYHHQPYPVIIQGFNHFE